MKSRLLAIRKISNNHVFFSYVYRKKEGIREVEVSIGFEVYANEYIHYR